MDKKNIEKIVVQTEKWSEGRKAAFRFAFIFFGLFIIINNNGAYPLWDATISQLLEVPLHVFIPWVGKHILHLSHDITVFTNGSGDTTYDYVLVFTIALTAFLGAIVWSVFDSGRTQYTVLYYWLTAAMRFYVGLMLFHYGIVKVIKLQFPAPGIYRLSEPLGDMSPMGLAWTFLGFSEGYNFFMGLAEIAALLLLFRRTMAMGAIIALMTTSNIMAVNYFYDVPVKIHSTALVLMTMFLLLNDAGKLFRLFFRGEATSLSIIQSPVFKKKWVQSLKTVFKFLLIGFAVIYGSIKTWGYKKKYGDARPRPALYGLYDVELFVLNHDTLSNTKADKDVSRWNQIVIEDDDFMRVRYQGDSVVGFLMTIDSIHHKIDFHLRADTTMRGTMHYKYSDPDKFRFSGTFKDDTVTIITKKSITETKNYRLIKRGFHWINERPYNK